MNKKYEHVLFIIGSIGLSILAFAVTVWLGIWEIVLAFNIGWAMGIVDDIKYPWEWFDVVFAGWFWMLFSYVRMVVDGCWWFKVRYRISEREIERFINAWLRERVSVVFSYPRVWVDGNCVLVVGLDDMDEIVKIESEIVSVISERFGVPRERIRIYWDDEWRYW